MVRYISDSADGDEDALTLFETAPLGYLVLMVNGRASQTFPLREEIELGRDKSNSLVVADKKVSRHHAILTPIDGSFIVADQGSANGTYLNGVLISQPTRLKSQDRIKIGDTTFLFTTAMPDVEAINREAGRKPVIPPAVRSALQNAPLFFIIRQQ